ncbi:hypothetical protein CDEF62S_02585 [Castellaniella defragrans]
MQPLPEPQPRFEVMAERVAEVQGGPHPGLAFVLGDHARLDLAGKPHGVADGVLIEGPQFGHMRLAPGEERRIGDHPCRT